MKAAGIPSHRPVRRAAIFLVGAFLLLVVRFWHPVFGFTRFLQLDATNDELKISAFRTHPVYVYATPGGYDGLYYAQIAYDPTSRSRARTRDGQPRLPRATHPAARPGLAARGRQSAGSRRFIHVEYRRLAGTPCVLWRLLAVVDARGLMAWAGCSFLQGHSAVSASH